jgi:hypothetical protein
LQEDLGDCGVEIISRSGYPAAMADLSKVSATAAETVLVLWPEDEAPDAGTAQQAAAVSALKAAGGITGQKLVVQSPGAQIADEYNAAVVCWG